jgi:hypothetical protein
MLLQLIFFLFVFLLITLISAGLGSDKGKSIPKSIVKGWSIFGGLIALLVAFALIREYFTGKMHVDKGDIYGSYVIDRDKFPGKNADWQYERFRFEIIEPDVFKFHKTYDGKITKTYTGKVEFTLDNRPHIILHMQYPDGDTCHVLRENPTLYREPFSFYYVFESPLFGNMFFTKGKYEQRQ